MVLKNERPSRTEHWLKSTLFDPTFLIMDNKRNSGFAQSNLEKPRLQGASTIVKRTGA